MISESHSERQTRKTSGGKSPVKRLSSVLKRSLDPREAVALQCLTRFSMMTSEQLAMMKGCSLRPAQKAFAGLVKKGLACYSGVLPQDLNLDTPQRPKRIFSLTKEGAAFVQHHECSWALIDRPPVGRNWSGKANLDREIRHKLGVVDCMIWLCRSVDTFRDLEIIYLSPDFIRDEDNKSINKSVFGDDKLIPDIVVSVLKKSSGRARTFFVEYDRGTTPFWMEEEGKGGVTTINEKLSKYDRYFKRPEHKTSASNPMLLFVCEKASRLRDMRATPRLNWRAWKELDERVLLSCRDLVSGGFLESNWHMPETDECKPIVVRETA